MGGIVTPTAEELENFVRSRLVAVQQLLRERFENRVVWVDGRWQWRREKAPEPPAARSPEQARRAADIGRLFEILAHAQFRNQLGPTPPRTPVAKQPAAPEAWAGAGRGAPAGALAGGAAPAEGLSGGNVCLFAIMLIGAVGLVLSLSSHLPCFKKLSRRMEGWFSPKARAVNERADEAQAPSSDDPPPPYCDGSAEPFLPPGGLPREGGGELPPPYCSYGVTPADLKHETPTEQNNNRRPISIDREGSATSACDAGAGAADAGAPQEVRVPVDMSRVVVV